MDSKLTQFHGVEGRDQITFSILLYYEWKNKFLHWRPSMNGGITKMTIPVDRVCRPEMVLYESLLDDFDSKHQAGVELYNDGTCYWYPVVKYVAGCSLDMTFYPYDTQYCPLKFGSWTFTSAEVNLGVRTPTNNVTGVGQTGLMFDDPMKPNSTEWEILSTDGMLNFVEYPCCIDLYAGEFLLHQK
ncbi:Oidioi.mRNA.OKI2018_I69.chr2.g4834.t1.cds [Oikopleura dioica]|uniref:Oidioi.mRNA.OKI2018_I69.chr2.g4834.t1.cds n=1 Tax=Oikopleura dioica TaxID=34765 RepID=A0ABN7SYZ7_OIKDI|nr:Oidioi.mRNA.OKI2018_I69.chr2.g4834.t1.cds [Oikopleura dioica]